MEALIIFVVFFIAVFMSIPIGIAMGLAVIVYIFAQGTIDFNYIVSGMFTATDSFPLMAICTWY